MPTFRIVLEYPIDDPDTTIHEEIRSWLVGDVNISDFTKILKYAPLIWEASPDCGLSFSLLPDPPEPTSLPQPAENSR